MNHINTRIGEESAPPAHLMTLDEVRELLHVSKWSVYQLVNNGRLQTLTIGRRRLVAPADFEKLVEQLRQEGRRDVW